MINIVKKLATLLIALGFISMSCAATHSAMPLGGTPRVESVGLTIGMSTEDLNRELGTPHGTDQCVLPFMANGAQAGAQGRSFIWEHETSNIPEQTGRQATLIVCVIDDTVVAEHRGWLIRNGNLLQKGQTSTVNLPLVQSIMDNLLRPDPANGEPRRLLGPGEFEI